MSVNDPKAATPDFVPSTELLARQKRLDGDGISRALRRRHLSGF